MSGLFPAGSFRDFGPCALDPRADIPSCQLVEGLRPAALRRQVRLLCPKRPGIYGMIDRHGELIYVGKAKNLRARLLSYFRPRSRDRRSAKIIGQSRAIAWEGSAGEFVALLRELEMIRRWRPRWNVQGQPLRRRQVFVCLGRRPAPHVFLAAKPPRTALALFGPIAAGPKADAAVCRLNDFFQLRDCPQPQEFVFPEQGELFPLVRTPGCLRYEIGTCLGPCTGTCERKDYQAKVRAARSFLAGADTTPLDELEAAMTLAAHAQHYERAAALRDRLEALRWLTQRLQRLRHAREKMSFVYPVTEIDRPGLWFLIHGGRTIAAVVSPHDADTRRRARAAIARVYFERGAALLESYEHIDGMLLVSSWFRKHPRELKKTFTPQEALEKCAQVARSRYG